MKTSILAIAIVTVAAEFASAGEPKAQPCQPTEPALAQVSSAAPQRAARRRRKFPPYIVSGVTNGGSISGVVTYHGALPAPRKIQVVKDHQTCNQHPKEVPLMKVDGEGRVAEAVVFLADVKTGKKFPPIDTPRIDQRGCQFHPHVQVILAKAPFDIANSDPVAHNMKADQGINTLFNVLQPKKMVTETTIDSPGLVEVRCNVHDWMWAFVYILPHPYFFVTEADGAFKIDDIPPGKYTLVVWQEHVGEQEMTIEVPVGGKSEVKFDLLPRGDNK